MNIDERTTELRESRRPLAAGLEDAAAFVEGKHLIMISIELSNR